MLKKTTIVFEDDGWRGFGPLTLTRPVWSVRSGIFTFADRLSLILGKDYDFRFSARKSLRELLNEAELPVESPSRETLFINGRAILTAETVSAMQNTEGEARFQCPDGLIGFKANRTGNPGRYFDSEGILDSGALSVLPQVSIAGKLIRYPWEIVAELRQGIMDDFDLVRSTDGSKLPTLPPDVIVRSIENISIHGEVSIGAGTILNAENSEIRLEGGVGIGPGAIIDADDGPVWVDSGAQIQPGAILLGPVYIGPQSIIRPGARLYGGVSLGPQCRAGGEISGVVMQGYSNKQHSGYLGNAFLGEWVNLGAATDNSDLKNNYRPVDVIMNGERIDTGELHIGAIIGDFSRSAIHTRLNTGTVVGVCCNLFGSDFPQREVPAFTWLGSDGAMEYRLDKALETMRIVMERRGKDFTPAREWLLTTIFEETIESRGKFLAQF